MFKNLVKKKKKYCLLVTDTEKKTEVQRANIVQFLRENLEQQDSLKEVYLKKNHKPIQGQQGS